MDNNLVTKGNVDITRTANSSENKLIRIVNHPATKWVFNSLLGAGTLYTGYKITDNLTKNGYDGSMNLLGLVRIDLTKHDKS